MDWDGKLYETSHSFVSAYGVDVLDMLGGICKRRGFVLRGGEYDLDRGSRALIDDFRKGRLGRITLENAADYIGFFG